MAYKASSRRMETVLIFQGLPFGATRPPLLLWKKVRGRTLASKRKIQEKQENSIIIVVRADGCRDKHGRDSNHYRRNVHKSHSSPSLLLALGMPTLRTRSVLMETDQTTVCTSSPVVPDRRHIVEAVSLTKFHGRHDGVDGRDLEGHPETTSGVLSGGQRTVESTDATTQL